jgi:hypothetical protein
MVALEIPFPLTPALSPMERETHRPPSSQPSARRPMKVGCEEDLRAAASRRAIKKPATVQRCPLSLGERVRVRGNRMSDLRTDPHTHRGSV